MFAQWLVSCAGLAVGSDGGGRADIHLGGSAERAPVPAPPLAPPNLARVRVGDTRWSAGTGASYVAVSGDHLLVSGDQGVAMFDADSGGVLERLSREEGGAVAFVADGRPAWFAGVGTGRLMVHGETVRSPCWDPAPWSLGSTLNGELAWTCDQLLAIGRPDEDPRTVPLPDAVGRDPRFSLSPDGSEAAVWDRDTGVWRVPLKGRGEPTLLGADYVGARWAPDGRFAIWTRSKVEVDGRKLDLPGDTQVDDVAFELDGGRIAVLGQDVVHVVGGGRKSCTAQLGAHGTMLAFGSSRFLAKVADGVARAWAEPWPRPPQTGSITSCRRVLP